VCLITGTFEDCWSVIFQQMLHDVIELYTSLLRGAYLPGSLMRLEPRHIGHSESPRTAWRDHKQDSHLAWLPLCVRQVRCVWPGLLLQSAYFHSHTQEVQCWWAQYTHFVWARRVV